MQSKPIPQILTILSTMDMPSFSPEEEVLHDYAPFLFHYKSGRIHRLMGEDVVPPSLDPQTGVESKDVVISPEINLAARLFRPKSASLDRKLPLLVFFHGGGFFVESAFSPVYTKYLNVIVAEANVIAVSVNYRLAPEHPLPIAYEDSWLSVKWVVENPDEWIRDFADLDRVYFGGDSAGGNIAHNMAMRAGMEKLQGLNLRGMFLNCPFFWGAKPVGSEVEGVKLWDKFRADDMWRYVCPGSTGCDDPFIDPCMHSEISNLGAKRVLVYVGENDLLKNRGWHYKELLEKSSWDGEVEIVEVEGEGHVFDVINPVCEKSIAILKKVAEFINQQN